MEILESADPLPSPAYTVGLAYNLKKGIKSEIEDIEAEYDSIDTVYAIKKSLEKLNCKVVLFEANEDIYSKLMNTKTDIVFNIAEGTNGRCREAQIPALLNFLEIPFTGSDEATLCLALDKALAKRILATYKIKTPRYQVLYNSKDKSGSNMKYPLIVKPNAEGSSKGISDCAVVKDRRELKALLDKNFAAYGQAMLVEEFIEGREFTVGVINNGEDAFAFPPMEIKFINNTPKYNVYSFNVKKNYKDYVEYISPAQIDKSMEEKMINTSKKIFKLLECRDFARIDFRLSPEGELYFIEINPLPGLAPGYSDFPMLAEFNGVDYDTLIKMIFNSGLKRLDMKPVV